MQDIRALLGCRLEMQSLSRAMAGELARRTLERSAFPPDEAEAVVAEVLRPEYAAQCSVPIMVTLRHFGSISLCKLI